MMLSNYDWSAIFNNIFKLVKLKIALLFLVTISLVAPVSGKEKLFNYLKNGVSFSLPEEWKTISDEALPGKGYYFSSESSKNGSTGLFTLVTINTEENPVKSILIQQKNMKNEVIYQESGIEFTTIESGRFGSMEAKTVNYESVIKGIKVSGSIYCFNCSEKTYMVFLQTGMKDQKANAKIFRLIELTFSCR